METRFSVMKAKHTAAVKRYQAAILCGTSEEMVLASDAVETAHRALSEASRNQTTEIQRATRRFAEAA